MENIKSYEDQKQEILKIAEDNFGNEYFQQLDRLTKDYIEEEEEAPKYSLTVNYKGAFYAYEE